MNASRRSFLTSASALAAAAALETGASESLAPGEPAKTSPPNSEARISLDGSWQFQLDPESSGEIRNFPRDSGSASGWKNVRVPHTWQIDESSAGYFGAAWYRRTLIAPPEWAGHTVRIEFEGVFHSASLWVNGKKAGEHLRKGYTAFTIDVTHLLLYGQENVIAVKVENTFDDNMLPRGRSSDWTPDGGIYRPVSLLITPRVYIERVDVDADPDITAGTAMLDIAVFLRNSGATPWKGKLSYIVVNEQTGLPVLTEGKAAEFTLKANESKVITLPAKLLRDIRLWHFDAPRLYSLRVELTGPHATHEFATTFGIRKIEIKDGSFYLNGERVRLMGVERMAGSNPEFGMSEPSSWIDHDHNDLKELNCVFTRVHWQQDKRVLEYCDRNGIFIQEEVPAWGGDTFGGMTKEPAPGIMENGLEQLREMVARDRNHPCIFSWGLCNEIGGQNPPAFQFVKKMYEEAKKIDPHRLCSYASNSLESNPAADATQLVDFVEANEYYETWAKGTLDDLRRNLEEIHRAFPDKPVVISEYGYCACVPERPESDARRIEILRKHTEIFRETSYIGGLIFFCYNDYRTHVGFSGVGVMKHNVHGVVDLLGARKPSFETLRKESSPVEAVEVNGSAADLTVRVRSRKSVPSYALRGYILRAILYGSGDIPLEQHEAALPVLHPGEEHTVVLQFQTKETVRINVDVMRPTGFSAATEIWRP
jgi:beta-galactosidase